MKWSGQLAAAGVALFFTAMPAAAIERGAMTDGRAYVSGGVGFEEREILAPLRGEYRFRLVTATRGSGAFLAGVRVRISDDRGRVLLDRETAGPELLANLAPGRYAIEASVHGQTQQASTTVGAGRRELYLYFDLPAETLPQDAIERR